MRKQGAILVYAQRVTNGFDRNQIVELRFIDEIILRENRVNSISDANQTPVLTIAVQSEAVIVIAVEAEDDTLPSLYLSKENAQIY